MTPRRSSRLFPVLLIGTLLLAATPCLAASGPERPAASSLSQLLHELWAQLTEPFASLFGAAEDEAPGGAAASGPSAPAGTDDPLAQPQHGHQVDPDG